MNVRYSLALSSILLGCAIIPVQAGGLLGIIGESGDDALVTIGSGPAGDSGAVNIGLGRGDSDSGNLVDVGVGRDRVVGLDVSTRDGIEANVGVGGLVDGRVGIGSGGRLLDVDIGVLDGAVGVGVGVGGGGTGGGGNAPGGANGGNGGSVAGIGGSQGRGLPASCVGASTSQVVALIQGTRIGSAWQRASNVAVQRVSLCPELASLIRAQLRGNGFGQALQSAVMSDSLISASLNRTNYDAGDVLAVRSSGSQLTVYVY